MTNSNTKSAKMIPKTESEVTLDAKGSRFIAILIPISQFDARVSALWAEHRKASHIVTATRIMAEDGTVLDRAKDDGEPGGTAGMPVLKVMIGAGLVEAGIAVVRYFGGTKLGTGGLARAYGGAASLAVEAATLVEWQRIVQRTLRAGFADAGALETAIAALPLTVIDRRHTEDGTVLTVRGPERALGDESLAGWMQK